MAALGSNEVSLKGDADEGQVTLSFDGNTYTRTLHRTGDGVVFSGDSYFRYSTSQYRLDSPEDIVSGRMDVGLIVLATTVSAQKERTPEAM